MNQIISSLSFVKTVVVQSRDVRLFRDPAGQKIPTSRDKNPGQSRDGPAVPGFDLILQYESYCMIFSTFDVASQTKNQFNLVSKLV